MLFNFDECIDRCHSNSYKWQKYAGRGVIPLWVADTDFRSPPCIIEALHARVDHGVFGYGAPPTALSDIFIERMREHYQWDVKAEWLVFLPGMLSGLHLAVRSLTETAEAVVIPSPIYPPFRARPPVAQVVHSAWRRCVLLTGAGASTSPPPIQRFQATNAC